MMECIAMDMRAQGILSSKILSFDGVQMETLQCPLTDSFRTLYDGSAA